MEGIFVGGGQTRQRAVRSLLLLGVGRRRESVREDVEDCAGFAGGGERAREERSQGRRRQSLSPSRDGSRLALDAVGAPAAHSTAFPAGSDTPVIN